jgi:DNA-binding NarL/FixJ family response regulator
VNVLVIEDDPPFARLLGALLNANGDEYAVERVGDLAAGLARLAAGDIDAVLTDLGLPDSKGLATYRAVRARARDLPVVIVSGGDDDAVALEAVREGADDYLIKGGITDRGLRRAVSHAAERKRLTRELQAALADVRTLRGIIPICAACKHVRDDTGAWQQVELYVREHSQADFSHGICPACAARLYGQEGSVA